MKPTKLIQNKIDANQRDIKECQIKNNMVKIGAIALTGISFLGAMTLNTLIAGISLPLVLFGSFFPVVAINYSRCKHAQMEANNRQNNHLKKIQKNGIERDEELDRLKSTQISTLDEQQRIVDNRIINHTVVVSVGIVAWLLGTTLSFVSTQALFAAVGGLLTSGIAMNNITKNTKKYLKFETKIENLSNDLILGPVYGVKKNNNDHTNTSEGITEKNNARASNNSYDSDTYDNEQIINDYVEKLEKIIETPNPKIKTKK